MGAEVEVVIIGSGFAGLGAGALLARRGEKSFVILEQADRVGGVWRENTYPGCACDVRVHLYSFSFEPNPDVYSIVSAKAARDPKWHVFNMALSDIDGTAEFHIMAAHQFSSIAKPAERLDPIFTERNSNNR